MNKPPRRLPRSRIRVSIALLAVIGVGIVSRLGAQQLPIIGKEFGDAVSWSVMFFLIALLAWPMASTLTAALLALAVSFAIEFLETVSRAMDRRLLRAGRVTGFLVGHAFVWRDFVSYVLGTLAAVAGDRLLARNR